MITSLAAVGSECGAQFDASLQLTPSPPPFQTNVLSTVKLLVANGDQVPSLSCTRKLNECVPAVVGAVKEKRPWVGGGEDAAGQPEETVHAARFGIKMGGHAGARVLAVVGGAVDERAGDGKADAIRAQTTVVLDHLFAIAAATRRLRRAGVREAVEIVEIPAHPAVGNAQE